MDRTTLEVIAPSVENAVEQGLAQLGIPREDVDVEILDFRLAWISGKSAAARYAYGSP